ncbi:uridine kinase [Streptomyces sp. NPDC002209]|uniref:uridine kinase family protein n=1 Tax=Streptomyces sp. NPDC002209 TaxID=3364638 RepID=UPI00367C5EEE
MVALDDFYSSDPVQAPSVAHRRSGAAIVDKGDPLSVRWDDVAAAVEEARRRAGLVVVEGIFALAEAMPELAQTRVFLDTPADLCLARKLLRKVRDENEPADEVVLNYLEHGRDTYLRHILPTMRRADLVLDGILPARASALAIHRQLAAQEGR